MPIKALWRECKKPQGNGNSVPAIFYFSLIQIFSSPELLVGLGEGLQRRSQPGDGCLWPNS
jgi:hypothetical protein